MMADFHDRYYVNPETETEEDQAPGIFDPDVIESLGKMGIKDQDTLRTLLNSSLRKALSESQPRQQAAQPEPQAQPQQQPDQSALAVEYAAEMRQAAGSKQKVQAIKAKYQAAGLDVDQTSPISGRYYGELPEKAEQQPQADPLAAEYRAEVLANRGKGSAKLAEIKDKYRRKGFNPEGVSFR
jgi:hypothetical protein